jgi:tetratricopeptide (TPR) repeat protein
MLEYVVEARVWGDSPLFLLDVGASGGVEPHWYSFRDLLRATGFEPLVFEAERLSRAAKAGVTYEAAFVGCRDYDKIFPPDIRFDPIRSRSNDVMPRTSAMAAQAPSDYIQQQYNAGRPPVYSDRRITLDEYVRPSDHAGVDFIKIDTDGHDIEVLLGAQGILTAGGALGVSIEVQLQGAVHDSANTFTNIDRIMRSHGFSLFDLEVYRYSREALPARFLYPIPANTVSGQTLWGEAVYFRDFGDADYSEKWGLKPTPVQVLKLACLFELFGLPDCAAELLLRRGHFLEPAMRDRLLDLLVPLPEQACEVRYREFVASFRRDPTSFFPGRHGDSLNTLFASAKRPDASPALLLRAAEAAEQSSRFAFAAGLYSRLHVEGVKDGRTPGEQLVLYRLGSLLKRLGKTRAARPYLYRSLSAAQTERYLSAAAHFHLGELLHAERQVEEAAEHYRAALQLAPAHGAAADRLRELQDAQSACIA